MTTGIPEINVNVHDLYQLLIGNLRYAYTRNNHLMPSSAFDQTLRILKDMMQAYPKGALMTAKQICEECILLQIMNNFSNGVDDEYVEKYTHLSKEKIEKLKTEILKI